MRLLNVVGEFGEEGGDKQAGNQGMWGMMNSETGCGGLTVVNEGII